MSSATTSTQDEAERREAARALMSTPFLHPIHHAETLTLTRRHAAALRQMFNLLGYPLIIEPTFARLVKAPLPPHVPARPARRRSGAEFTPRAYTHLALLCAGLLTPATGDQVLITALVDQLRADAATAGIPVEDSLTERRAVVAAIELLCDWGVLAETDGTAAIWGERESEALLTVNRGLLPHLLARPLRDLTGPTDLTDTPTSTDQPRQTLRRQLSEHPMVGRQDLTAAELDVLSRERTELSAHLADTLGLGLEVRAEGALAFDPDSELTDLPFPGPGTLRQAALLLLDALIDTLRPAPGANVTIRGEPHPGVLADDDMLAETMELLVEQHGRAWSVDLLADPGRLLTGALEILEAHSLLLRVEGGVVIHPAAARYRPQPERAPAPRLPRPGTSHPQLGTGSPTLFGTGYDSETP